MAGLLLLGCLGAGAARAQNVSNYTFTQSAGTYTELAAPRVLAASTPTDGSATDDQVYAASLPFAFTFNGASYTSISVNTNGFITFGAGTSQAATYEPLSGTDSYSGAVAALASDLAGRSAAGILGELSYATLGSSPNRAFVVQWKNYVRFGQPDERLNFQVQLSETTNTVSIVYGGCAPAAAVSAQQVGLRGRSNADFASRAVPSGVDWGRSAVGGANSSTATLSAQTYPGLGLTYTFAVPPPAAPTALVFSGVSAEALTVGFTDNSLNESSFQVQYGTDPTFATASRATLLSTTQATVGATYAVSLTNLAPATTYYVRVQAVGEALSAPLDGAQATAALQGMAVTSISYAQNGALTYRGLAGQPVLGLAVATTGAANPLALGSLTFDLGSTSVADIANPQLYRTSTGTFDLAAATPLPAAGNLPATGSTCTLTLATADPLATGSTYYWLTYDVPAAATPGHTLAATPTAAVIGSTRYTAFSLGGAAATRLIALPLSGTYAVGAGGDYPTLTAALADLGRRGVATGAGAAGVTLALTNPAAVAEYNEANGETFPLVLRTAPGMDATHRVTIRPAAGVQASISGQADGTGVVVSQGGDYFTLEGANTAGGRTRDLRISNTSRAASAVVWLQSQGPGAGATYNQVRNLSLQAGTNDALTFGVLVGNAVLGFDSQGADNDYVSIENNSLTGCYVGVLAAGTASVSAGGLDGLSIAGNLLGPATAGALDNLGYAGLEVSYALAPTLGGNTVRNVRTASNVDATGIYVHHATGLVLSGNTVAGVAVATTSGQYSAFGVYLGRGVANAVVSGNTIRGIANASTNQAALPTGIGLYVGTATPDANVELRNNFVSSVSGQFGPIGIFLDGSTAAQSGLRLYYNSVGLQGSYASYGGALSAALYVPVGTTGLDMRNNLLANALTSNATSAAGYALYSPAGAASYAASDYNDYYVSGAQNQLAQVGSSTCLALADLQSPALGTGQDAHSLASNPDFASDTDLHISNRVLAAGVPLGGIGVDIDGDVRSATAPTIGADELLPLSVDVQPVALAAPAPGAVCFGSAEPLAVAVRNTTAATLDFTLHPLLVTVAVSGAASQSFSLTIGSNAGNPGGLPLAGGATVTVPLPGTLDMTAVGTYTFAAAATAAGDGNTANDALGPQVFTNNTPPLLPAAATLSSCGGSSTSVTYSGYGNLRVSPAAGAVVSGSTVTFSPALTTTYTISGTSLDAAQCLRTATATVTVNSLTTWTGARSTDWLDAGNWSACVPTRITDALLPAGAPRYPSLGSGTAAEVRSLTVAAGASLAQSAGTLSVYGSLTSRADAASVAFTGGAVALRGSAPQVAGVAALYDLQVNLASPLASATLTDNLAVTHAAALGQGLLNTGLATLTLGPGATLAETEDSYVVGEVRVPGRDLAAGQGEDFGGIGLVLTPSATSAVLPGATTVVRTTGVALRGIASSQSILRYFNIQPTVDENLDVRMELRFWEHERNGIAAGNLQLYKSVTGPTGPWLAQLASLLGTTAGLSKDHITDFSTWTAGSTANPLPVQLVQFDATRQGAAALLTWTTASEQHNRGFEVQASADGQAFAALGFVAGAGTSATTQHYRYLDQAPAPAGRRYYRLRQLDQDGTATFSPVRTLAFDAAPVPAVQVQAAPNPFSTSLQLSLTLPTEAPVALTLTDALGRVVYQQALGTLPAGTHQPELAGLGALPPGLYVLRVSVAGQPYVVKVVKE